MNAITYMLRKTIKNSLLELVRHPLKLIAYAFVVGMMLFSGLINMLSPPETGKADPRMLEGIYLGILLLAALPTLFTGMRSGANLFSMADVNLLFVSPITPKKNLLYGLTRQMGTMLLVCFFFIAYGGMAVSQFGISIPAALGLLLGFGVSAMIVQLLTMVIYSYVNGRPRRIRGVKYAIYTVLLAAAVYIGLNIYRPGLSMESALAAVSDPVLEFLPVFGWMKGLLFAAMAGEAGRALLFGGLLILGTGGCLLLFLHSDADYYEDVLQNAENTYELRAAVKEGRMATKPAGRTVKVRGTGLGGGWGASAFFFKQVRELRRRSRLVFVGGSTILLLAVCLFMAIVMAKTGKSDGETLSPNIVMMITAIIGVYLQMFTSAAGPWGQELAKPYLYLAPVSPLKKLLWASLTSLIHPVVDGIVVYTVVAIAVHGSALTAVVCMLLYITFGWLFTAANILSQRVLGTLANRGLLFFLYLLLLMIVTAPGLIAGIVLMVAVEGRLPISLGGLPVAAWNVLAAFGIYALCRNTLHDMEAR